MFLDSLNEIDPKHPLGYDSIFCFWLVFINEALLLCIICGGTIVGHVHLNLAKKNIAQCCRTFTAIEQTVTIYEK